MFELYTFSYIYMNVTFFNGNTNAVLLGNCSMHALSKLSNHRFCVDFQLSVLTHQRPLLQKLSTTWQSPLLEQKAGL